jgi:hypothetical protein
MGTHVIEHGANVDLTDSEKTRAADKVEILDGGMVVLYFTRSGEKEYYPREAVEGIYTDIRE